MMSADESYSTNEVKCVNQLFDGFRISFTYMMRNSRYMDLAASLELGLLLDGPFSRSMRGSRTYSELSSAAVSIDMWIRWVRICKRKMKVSSLYLAIYCLLENFFIGKWKISRLQILISPDFWALKKLYVLKNNEIQVPTILLRIKMSCFNVCMWTKMCLVYNMYLSFPISFVGFWECWISVSVKIASSALKL